MTDKSVQKITLFKDVVSPDGKTTSTTVTQTLKTSRVSYITCSTVPAKESEIGDVILVCKGGEVLSLSAETLSTNWAAVTKSSLQDVVATKIDELHIEYTASGSLSDFTDGMFKNKPEVFSALPKSVEAGEPELLALVARSSSKDQTSRHLIVLAAMRGSAATSDMQKLVPLDISPIPSTLHNAKGRYQVDIHSATLFQLQGDVLTTFDISGAIPKPKSTFDAEGAATFTKLSRPFVLTCSLDTITLFNYQYRSMHAKVALDLSELPAENQSPRSCRLLSYVRSQDIAVALIDNALVSIHVEPPSSHGKRRKEGLLIDSIGRGTTLEAAPKRAKHNESVEFSRQVPGTMTESYLEEYRAQVLAADELLANNELEKWETLLREKFHMDHSDAQSADSEVNEEAGEWQWHRDGSKYAAVDRRWVIYALSQAFSIEGSDSEHLNTHIRMILPDSNVMTYLVVAGHITISNLRSAFVEELNGVDDRKIASDLIGCITDAEPSMSLLLNYLQATKLGEAELILAIRALMLSMDLIPDTRKMNSTKLLKDEAHEPSEMDLDDLEREIEVTEHYLGDDSSSRSRGLTLAFTKLWRQPAIATVRALRTTVRTEEVLAFIYLLRMELVRGAWTSLYVDTTSFESEGNEPPPDGVITLIADLLGRCMDAIGSGGWLFNDAMSWADKAETGDFLTALRLEVTAALEGIEEAVHMNGLVGEAVRYNQAVQKNGAGRQAAWTGSKPMTVQLENQENRVLPLGLKVKQMPTKEKIVSGGEVVQRTARETGHLISQKVEAYSLEKLAI